MAAVGDCSPSESKLGSSQPLLDSHKRYQFTTSMKSLHIRNLDDGTLEGLKRRARRHRRSLQKEVESLLSDAARMLPPEASEEAPRTLRLNRVSTGNTSSDWTRESIYGDDGR